MSEIGHGAWLLTLKMVDVLERGVRRLAPNWSLERSLLTSVRGMGGARRSVAVFFQEVKDRGA